MESFIHKEHSQLHEFSRYLLGSCVVAVLMVQSAANYGVPAPQVPSYGAKPQQQVSREQSYRLAVRTYLFTFICIFTHVLIGVCNC